MASKICNKCDIERTLDNYYYRENRNCYDGICRPCNKESAQKKRQSDEVQENMKKACSKYYMNNKNDLNKTSKEYYEQNKEAQKEKYRKQYLKHKETYIQRARDRRAKIKNQALNGLIEKPKITHKVCTCCGENKEVSFFSYLKTKAVYDCSCKECNTIRERKRRANNSEKIKAQRRLRKKPLTYEQRLAHNLRKRLNGCVKNRNGKNLYLKLLGCDKKFLILWFEYNFVIDHHIDMNWNNYGSLWEIDHVKPCASFDFSDIKQQEKCFHWTNLVPVLGSYNSSKQDKIKILDEMRQEIRVRNFIKSLDNTQHNYKMLNS